MARMYPNQLSPDTTSNAEQLLYEAFRDQLEDDYMVFHSVAWLSQDQDGRPRDGEADFVIAHPERGVLVVEVKGGTISYDSASGKWTSIDRNKRRHGIKDPFAQARDNKYILLDALKRRLSQPKRRINIGHAVAFPSVLVERDLPGMDKPRQIILDSAGMANLSEWTGQVLAYWRGQETQKEVAPGRETIKALIDILAKDWELRPALWGDFAQEKQQLIRLTRQQYLILDMLNRQRRAVICGCAGSGKTMLAAEKASRLARQGFRVLLTCFNKNLAADLRNTMNPTSNLDIVHFHELCYELAQQGGVLPVKEDGRDQQFYNQQLPEALAEAADTLDIHYDAIVVDEGQDFRDNWWLPLQMLLSDPGHGILYIFFDDNQRIYVPRSEFPIQGAPYMLTTNCRNTQNIHQVVIQFYEAETQPTALGPRGRRVEEITYTSVQHIWPSLQEVLRRLTEEERIPTDEIAVLTPLLRTRDLLLSSSLSEGPQLTDSLPAQSGQVYCTTIHSFKGLERSVIILAGIGQQLRQEAHDLNLLLYVGCSRARHHLVVLMPENADHRVTKAFAAARRGKKAQR